MPERKSKVDTVRVDYLCKCGGKMYPTGIVLTSCPPVYPHACQECGAQEPLSKYYPAIEYEDIIKEMDRVVVGDGLVGVSLILPEDTLPHHPLPKSKFNEPERKCPENCGGCSCHMSPPCAHCVDHWDVE